MKKMAKSTATAFGNGVPLSLPWQLIEVRWLMSAQVICRKAWYGDWVGIRSTLALSQLRQTWYLHEAVTIIYKQRPENGGTKFLNVLPVCKNENPKVDLLSHHVHLQEIWIGPSHWLHRQPVVACPWKYVRLQDKTRVFIRKGTEYHTCAQAPQEKVILEAKQS